MPIGIADFTERLKPTRTTLLLGAGASVPSGAPTGEALAKQLWSSVAHQAAQSTDLVETATILARRYGRPSVVDVVVSALSKLSPSGGLLALSTFGWKSVYTTNFDCLWESACDISKVSSYSIRSNYDWSIRENSIGTPLYKLHGCVSQDEALGHKSSMLLTEQDYEKYEQYRQLIFLSLNQSLLEGDALVVGQSLRDRHLDDLIKRVLRIKHQSTLKGQIYVVVFEQDDLRAPLLEDRGAKIVFAGIDDISHALACNAVSNLNISSREDHNLLPAVLLSTVVDYKTNRASSPNVLRMFNGGAATLADISIGSTFERLQFQQGISVLQEGTKPIVTLTGAGGVGKTTLARQLLCELSSRDNPAWEHQPDFPMHFKEWRIVEARLRSLKLTGFLLIDECTRFMRPVNLLAEYLATIERPGLRLILTANSAQWVPRLKSADIFKKGVIFELSRLDDSEINSLINLIENNSSVRDLVSQSFKQKSRSEQFSTLRQRCSADMYVCLKNIFANESLDVILLREYEALPAGSQEYYRYVAALQAVGAHVHRQLIIRMLNIPPDNVRQVLDGLKGIIDEYDIAPNDGVFGWATRHLVIARKITEYKFSSAYELTTLFRNIILNLNPSTKVEVQSVRDICDNEYGIGRLGNADERRSLYRQLIDVTPGERIPWHRLCREVLNNGDVEDADQVIRQAEETVGADAPIDRFKVRLLIKRAEKTQGISTGDRLALLRKAVEQARKNISRHKNDKYSYYTFCEAAAEAVQRGESSVVLDEALECLVSAAERILDPEMNRRAKQFREEFKRLC